MRRIGPGDIAIRSQHVPARCEPPCRAALLFRPRAPTIHPLPEENIRSGEAPSAIIEERITAKIRSPRTSGSAEVFIFSRLHFTKVTPTRASPEFAEFILDIAAHYLAAETIHLVMDNLSTHTRKALVDRFGEVMAGWLWDRFAVHYTPKHGSWLNQAEIEIGIFSRQCLGKQRIGDISTLRCQAAAWNCRTNRDNIKIQWKFTRKLARRKLNYSFTRSRH